MNKNIKESLAAFNELADAMAMQDYPGSGEELKSHMMLVSVAIAAAEGRITNHEIQCIRDYLDYPLTEKLVKEKILPNKLDTILTVPPSELHGFIAAESYSNDQSGQKSADLFVDIVDLYLDEVISADGSVDENETWVKNTYINMLKESVKKMRTAE